MKLQILQDDQGNNTGVFIPMKDWAVLKALYPDIESATSNLPAWEQELIDDRLQSMQGATDQLKDGQQLLKMLKASDK
ncbi:MAG: hypothetical protein MUF62_10345 [Chitinophagaceae bacterium]|nr:hypothetical protein [Chitinophagaceae bacterium]